MQWPPTAMPGRVDVAVRLRVAGLDHLQHVDPVRPGEPGELVGQADVDVPVGGLGQLRQLRRLGAAEVPDAVALRQVGPLVELEHRAVELDRAARPLPGQAADQLGVLAQVGEDAPGQHPLRAEHEVEVPALVQARALLQHRLPAGAGGADGEGRLVGDERSRCEVSRQGSGGRVQRAEVRLAGLLLDEQRHDHDHHVRPGHGVGDVGGRPQPPLRHEPGQLLAELRLAGEGLDPCVHEVHEGPVDVDPDDLVPAVGELHGERQPDLPEGENGDLHGVTPPEGLRCRTPAGHRQSTEQGATGRPVPAEPCPRLLRDGRAEEGRERRRRQAAVRQAGRGRRGARRDRFRARHRAHRPALRRPPLRRLLHRPRHPGAGRTPRHRVRQPRRADRSDARGARRGARRAAARLGARLRRHQLDPRRRPRGSEAAPAGRASRGRAALVQPRACRRSTTGCSPTTPATCCSPRPRSPSGSSRPRVSRPAPCSWATS